MVRVTADNRHLHPHLLIWGSEVKQYSVCKWRHCRREWHHLFYRYICNYAYFPLIPVCNQSGSIWWNICVVLLLMGKVDVCWVLGHQRWMIETGEHFCRLKFCGWKTTLSCWVWYGETSQIWGRQAVSRAHTRTHKVKDNTGHQKKSIQMLKWKCIEFNHIHVCIHKHLQKQKLTHTLASWTWLDVAVVPIGSITGQTLWVAVLSLCVSLPLLLYPQSDLSVSHELPVPHEEHVVFHHKAPGAANREKH